MRPWCAPQSLGFQGLGELRHARIDGGLHQHFLEFVLGKAALRETGAYVEGEFLPTAEAGGDGQNQQASGAIVEAGAAPDLVPGVARVHRLIVGVERRPVGERPVDPGVAPSTRRRLASPASNKVSAAAVAGIAEQRAAQRGGKGWWHPRSAANARRRRRHGWRRGSRPSVSRHGRHRESRRRPRRSQPKSARRWRRSDRPAPCRGSRRRSRRSRRRPARRRRASARRRSRCCATKGADRKRPIAMSAIDAVPLARTVSTRAFHAALSIVAEVQISASAETRSVVKRANCIGHRGPPSDTPATAALSIPASAMIAATSPASVARL